MPAKPIPTDIRALLETAERQLDRINAAYKVALAGADIPDETTVDIKNFLENHRSALDYLAMNIRRACCRKPKPNEKIYFPIRSSRTAFRRAAKSSFPGLETGRPDLYSRLDALQPYPQREENPLRDLNKLVNPKKHVALVRQVRHEANRPAEMPTQFGPAIFRKSMFDHGTEADAWISFRFMGMNRSAIWVLGRIHLHVGEIVEDIRLIL